MSVRHHDWLAHHARRGPARRAVVDLRSERHLTYRRHRRASTPAARPGTYSGHGMSLRQGFGRTETSPAVLVQVGRMALDRPGSARVPMLHNEARVVDEAGSVRS